VVVRGTHGWAAVASVLRVRAVLTGVPVSGRVLRCEERHGGAGAGHAEGRHPGAGPRHVRSAPAPDGAGADSQRWHGCQWCEPGTTWMVFEVVIGASELSSV